MSPAGLVVVDTGVLLAAADADDRRHFDAADLLDGCDTARLVLPTSVAAEAAWMIGSRLGAGTEAALVGSPAAGEFRLTELGPGDWSRCGELIATYVDLGLGLVVASVIAIAERLGITTVATIDSVTFASSARDAGGVDCWDGLRDIDIVQCGKTTLKGAGKRH